MEYNIIVVGGGHAGCEAALACARMGQKTLLITGNISNIADMPCNPSIGGPAKGIVVREIDALGGEMAKTTDKSLLQLKMLNTKKGSAVQALRAQADKVVYPREMLKTLKNQENLEIKENLVGELLTKENRIIGVKLEDGIEIKSQVVILTTGTYLKAMILVGSNKHSNGPHGEKASNYLSDSLRNLGFKLLRLKTGTPPRIAKNSIDFNKTKLETGDNQYYAFSFDKHYYYDKDNQIPCHLIYTTEKTHEIIKNNLEQSSMYGGYVEGVGPRYCPSIEDKIVRFSDKERHQLFLEPESIYYDDMYLQGFSTSMPYEVQEQMVHSLPGLENAVIKKYAYAIEYDAIDPRQLKQSLETKLIENLYTAGQINGSSGYEEAACQGLIAGINASLKLQGKEPLILKRNEAYIGVLIDDLVTKGIKDPYRLLTSRAEYRLLLRNDNADLRLREYGYQIGLVSLNIYQNFLKKKESITALISLLKKTKITPTLSTNDYLQSIGTTALKESITLYELVKRPEVTMMQLSHFIDLSSYEEEVRQQVEIESKYEGYIKKALREAEKMLHLEKVKIPIDLDYDMVPNIASEARQKLNEIHPATLGQASRISGVNPADITILNIYLKKRGCSHDK